MSGTFALLFRRAGSPFGFTSRRFKGCERKGKPPRSASESSDTFIGALGDRKQRLLRRTKGDLGGAEKKSSEMGVKRRGRVPLRSPLSPSPPPMAVLMPVPRLTAFQRGTSLSKRRFGCARSSAAARRGRGTELRPWDKGGGERGGTARRDGTRGSLRPWGGGAAVGPSSGALCHPAALRAT